MDWMRRQDVKEEPQEASNALTPEDDDECYFEEDTSVDEGMGLDNVSSATLRPFNSDINTPRIDSYRFSMANLEGKFAGHSLVRVYRPRFPSGKVKPDLSMMPTRARLEMRRAKSRL
ncbi:uncharacterized protein LOC112552773 isoform X2 [Pogonomyrmex barbatus]|uniref:Uncharacterized protein LOC112552773 isoform X2 n=1 Tax=Pogonomyrmex barbatus TaxID=144034 RepID=A0A8N1S8V9_9HYME|nr:uncharacterized protein LOC112552773 isoform X2 [Pogonomyrmex barbatus]